MAQVTVTCDIHQVATHACTDDCSLSIPGMGWHVTRTNGYTLSCGCVMNGDGSQYIMCKGCRQERTLYGVIILHTRRDMTQRTHEANVARLQVHAAMPPRMRTSGDLWTLSKNALAKGYDNVREYLTDCVKRPVTCDKGWCNHPKC